MRRKPRALSRQFHFGLLTLDISKIHGFGYAETREENDIEAATAQMERASRVERAVVMARDGAIIFRDLVGKLDVLNVECDKCGRRAVSPPPADCALGIDAKLFDWSDEITADCPRKHSRNLLRRVPRTVPGLAESGVRARSGPVVVSWNFEFPLIQINGLNERVSFGFSPNAPRN